VKSSSTPLPARTLVTREKQFLRFLARRRATLA